MNGLSYFCEPNIRRFFPKALTADVQPVLANETGGMGADAAVTILPSTSASHVGTLRLDV